jgi:hypothetical protein
MAPGGPVPQAFQPPRPCSEDQLSTTFAALADPTRRAILARLAEGEATVNQLICSRFVMFSDPDGNGWAVQEIRPGDPDIE